MNKTRRLLILASAVLLLAVLLAIGVTFAKYADNKSEKIPVSSKAFYFESDYLTEDNHKYTLNPGTTSVTFNLYNYENELRWSDVDCTYTANVETEDESFSLPNSTYTLTASEEAKSQEVTLTGLKNGYSYKVTVTATGGGYQKTLSATFTVGTADGFYMNLSDKGSYVVLTVWTENITGDVTISVPAGLIPDSTDPVLSSAKNYENSTYKNFNVADQSSFISPYSSHSYRFFKTSNYDNSTSPFTVTMGEKTATSSSIN